MCRPLAPSATRLLSAGGLRTCGDAHQAPSSEEPFLGAAEAHGLCTAHATEMLTRALCLQPWVHLPQPSLHPWRPSSQNWLPAAHPSTPGGPQTGELSTCAPLHLLWVCGPHAEPGAAVTEALREPPSEQGQCSYSLPAPAPADPLPQAPLVLPCTPEATHTATEGTRVPPRKLPLLPELTKE